MRLIRSTIILHFPSKFLNFLLFSLQFCKICVAQTFFPVPVIISHVPLRGSPVTEFLIIFVSAISIAEYARKLFCGMFEAVNAILRSQVSEIIQNLRVTYLL